MTRVLPTEENAMPASKDAPRPRVVEGSDNIFADLGFDDPEMELERADLSIAIHQRIEARGLTDAQAAERMGVPLKRVTLLLDGRLEGFTVGQLRAMLGALERKTKIPDTEEPARRASAAAVARKAIRRR